MSRTWPLLLILVAVGCAGPSRALAPKGFAEGSTTEETLKQALAPRRVAALVGVDAYSHPSFPDLRFAGSDATALAEVLRSEDGGFDRVELFAGRSDRTSRSAILEGLRAVVEELRPEDVLVVYYSGHGTITRREGGHGELYLLARDSHPGDLGATAIDLSVLQRWFSGLAPERKALVIDACFNGRGKSAVDPDLRADVPELVAQLDGEAPTRLKTGEAHLYATTRGRSAFEDDTLGRGVYTHYLLQAMTWARAAADRDEDLVLSAYEAHDYARARTMEHTRGEQIPEASMRIVGTNDLVLVGDPTRRRVRDDALVYAYPGHRGPYLNASLFIDGRAKGVFPGSIDVPPGKHHVEVKAPDGNVLVDGFVTLESGAAVRLRDLAVHAREERAMLAVSGGFGGGPPATWRTIWGNGFATVEVTGTLRRVTRPARGLTLGATFGAAFVPARFRLDATRLGSRPALWLGLGPGWAGGTRRLRARASWEARLTAVPLMTASGSGGPASAGEAGWIVFSTGPRGSIGIALDQRLTALVGGSVQLSAFGLEPEAPILPRVHGTITAGLEVNL